MSGLIKLVVPGVALASFLPTVAAAQPLDAATDSRYGETWGMLRSLAGTWDSYIVGQEGSENTITYHVTGGGAVVWEEFLGADPVAGEDGLFGGEMASAYHMDGEALMMTHYCGAGNQPRMRAVSWDGDSRTLSFDFLDVTHLLEPDDYHTTQLDIVFEDEDHVELWFRGQQAGEQTPNQVHRLTRRR